uniref:Putative secreted protein n=1 Tax=Anopheles darlingi TaxID=43151 RepID=A0A2M4D051_ANODA
MALFYFNRHNLQFMFTCFFVLFFFFYGLAIAEQCDEISFLKKGFMLRFLYNVVSAYYVKGENESENAFA